jgi:hypothetical protein
MKINKYFFKKLPLYTLAGFDLATHMCIPQVSSVAVLLDKAAKAYKKASGFKTLCKKLQLLL